MKEILSFKHGIISSSNDFAKKHVLPALHADYIKPIHMQNAKTPLQSFED